MCMNTRRLLFKGTPTQKCDDSSMYTKDGPFEIVKLEDKDSFIAKKITVKEYRSSTLNVPWALVGVYRDGGVKDGEPEVCIRHEQVLGKLLRTGELVITLPKQWLGLS